MMEENNERIEQNQKECYNDGGFLRCDCGRVIARVEDGYVIIRCRGCKREHWIPIEGGKNDVSNHFRMISVPKV